ncbi:unnamed protein product, partial [Rotaria sp. Silwood2]
THYALERVGHALLRPFLPCCGSSSDDNLSGSTNNKNLVSSVNTRTIVGKTVVQTNAQLSTTRSSSIQSLSKVPQIDVSNLPIETNFPRILWADPRNVRNNHKRKQQTNVSSKVSTTNAIEESDKLPTILLKSTVEIPAKDLNSIDRHEQMVHNVQLPEPPQLENDTIPLNHSVVIPDNDKSKEVIVEPTDTTNKINVKGNDRKISKTKKPSDLHRGLCGLENLGNTCFMNSALQCLSNVSELTEYILKNNGFPNDIINIANPLGSGGKVARSYGDLILKLWSGDHKSVAPDILKLDISKMATRFAGYNQEDSYELMNILLGTLHEDLIREDECDDDPDKEPSSLISDYFHFELQSTIVCLQCKKISKSCEPMSFLALSLPSSNATTRKNSNGSNHPSKVLKQSLSIFDCLSDLLQETNLIGENGECCWYCSECNELTQAKKT